MRHAQPLLTLDPKPQSVDPRFCITGLTDTDFTPAEDDGNDFGYSKEPDGAGQPETRTEGRSVGFVGIKYLYGACCLQGLEM